MGAYRKLLKKNRTIVIGLFFWTILLSAVSVAAGYSLSWIFDAYEATGNKLHALFWATAASAGLFCLTVLFVYIKEVLVFRMQGKIKTDLRELAAQKITSLSYDKLSQKDTGAYVSWMGNDVDALYEHCFRELYDGIEGIFSASFAFFVMMKVSWLLGTVAFILFVIQFIAPQLLNGFMKRAAERRSQAQERGVEGYKDTLMGADIFYLANLQQALIHRIKNTSKEAEKQIFQSNRTVCRIKTVITIINMSNQIILTGTAVLCAITGKAPMGIALSVANLCGQFFNGVTRGVQAVVSIRSTKPLWGKFSIEDKKQTDKKTVENLQEMTMQNLSFAYADKEILKERDFSFHLGGKYAICGESGSGKSTVIKLLLGLLPNYQGRICYDLCEQKQIDLPSLYDQIACVNQQVYLFEDSLRFNITLGQPCSQEKLQSVVKMCKLEKLVASLPDGLESKIEENGKNLSGGQRQRIALARAMIREVNFLILDEGTSALDEENAQDIEQSLMQQENKCVIFITHHLKDAMKDNLTQLYQL